MLNITTIENALRDWVIEVSDYQVIFAHPNAPRPITNYVLINIPSAVLTGVQESQFELLADDSIQISSSGSYELLVSINTYYAGAYQEATLLKDSLTRITVNETLYGHGIGYLRSTSVREIPEEVNKRWEERAQFDAYFAVRSLDSENIESIKKVELTNEITNVTTIIE